MENNAENPNEEAVLEAPQPSTEERDLQVSPRSNTDSQAATPQRPVSGESQELQSPTTEENAAQELQHSEGTENNAAATNNAAEPSAVAPSNPDVIAGGDNAHRVMECLREIIQCPVCFTVPFGMRIFCCRNGHSCCRQCLIHFRNTTRTLLRRPFCPVCRTSMVRRKVFRNFVAEQIIAEYVAILNENGETV